MGYHKRKKEIKVKEIDIMANNYRKKRNSNRKGGSYNAKTQTDVRDRNEQCESKEGKQKAPIRNNSALYFASDTLAKQVSNISFNQFMGSTVPQFNGTHIPNLATGLSVRLNPSIGFTEGDPNDGINTQALNLYATLSNSNSKTTLYAPQDVMTLILAVGEIISMIENGRRVLGVSMTFNERNRTYPRGVIKTLGFDPDTVLKGIANHRTDLNVIINEFNATPLLANIPYLVKCHNIYTTYFLDSESPMAAYWAFIPYSTWKLDEISYDQGTILRTSSVDGTVGYDDHYWKWEDYLTQLRSMVNALFGSATYNAIYSDILRLGDKIPQVKVALIEDDYVVLPEYNPMMNLQVHNSVALEPPQPAANLGNEAKARFTPENDVYPDVERNTLKQVPPFKATNQNEIYTCDRILDFPRSLGDPDIDQRIDATRYITCSQALVTFDDQLYLGRPVMPDHYVVQYTLHYGVNQTSTFGSYLYRITKNSLIFNLLSIDNGPMIGLSEDDNNTQIGGYATDLDWWTTVDYEWLYRLNDASLQGLFTMR